MRVELWRKLKIWCFWTVVLEKTLESPLDSKEIQPVHPKDQSWVFFGRTDVEAETPILWPPDVKRWFIWKDPDAGKDWGQEKKGMTEDEMVGWHHRLNRYRSGWNPGVGDGQGGLACCSSWGCKESHTTEQLNWTEWNLIHSSIHPTNIFKCLWSTRHCCRYGTTVIQGVQNMPLWYKNDFELKAQISYLKAEPPKRTERKKKKKPPLS